MANMDRIGRTLFVGFAIIAMTLFAVGVRDGCAKEATGEPIKIGVLFPLTSSVVASYIEPLMAALEWEKNMINASGGVLGRPLKLIVRDDKFNPEVALREAKSLVVSEGCQLIYGVFTASAGAAVSNYIKSLNGKALYITGIVTDSALTEERGHRYVFRIGFNSVAWSGVMAYEAPRRWPNKKRFYQINPNYAYGKACAKIFKEIVSKNVPGAEFVGESWPPLGNRDFVGYITSILAAKPDILQCTVYGSDFMSLLKQGEPYGLLQKTQMVCSEAGHQENAGMFKKGDVGAPIGVLCASLYDWYNQKGEEITTLAKHVYEKTGYYPGLLTRFSTLRLLKKGIEQAGSATDLEKIVNSLEGLTFDSPFGGPVTIRACDHQTTPDYKVGLLGWDETGKYNFPIIKADTIHVLSGKMLHHTCEEIKALREAEAKKAQ